MQNIIVAISILLAINALLLIFSVNRNEPKTSKALEEPPRPMNKLVKEEQMGYRVAVPNGTTVLRNIKQIEQEIKAQNKKREQEPIGEGHNSIG
jgi:hypothetical protein